MSSKTIFGELGVVMSIRTLLTWLFFSLVSSQNKGDRFQTLQTGESFNLTVGNLNTSGPNPGHLIVGGWFKWNRCSYAATNASASELEHMLLEPAGERNWIPVHLTSYNGTEARVFNCSSWQHIAVVYQINPTTGNMNATHVLHNPMIRSPLNYDENKTVKADTNTVQVLISLNKLNARFNVHPDLIQHRLFWYIDYKAPGELHQAHGVVAAYAQIVSGLTSPLIWVLNTDRHFNLTTMAKINGTAVTSMALTSLINDLDPASRPGFSLRWNTTYEFPDLIQLPDIDSEDSIQPCFTLILSFSVETQKNDIFHRISTFISIRGDDDSVLLKDFELRQHFGRLGGKQNGSNWQISPQDPTGQNLTTVINVCRFAGNHFVRHKLFKDDLLVVDSTIPTQPASDFPYSGQKLSVVLSTTSSVFLGNRLSLKEIRVSAGAADLTNVTLTQDPVPEGCLIATVVSSSGNSADPYCLKCAATHFWSLGDCTPQNSKKAGLNSTCSYYEEVNSCSSCKSGFKADIFRYECYPASAPC